MKLTYSSTSPFVRKIIVLLHETGQSGDVEMITPKTSPVGKDAWLLASNPLGKMPTLIREDAPALYDSRVICRYLDDRAKAGLYPAARLWETLTLEATADGMMDAAVLMLYQGRLLPPTPAAEEWTEGQWNKVAMAVSVLNGRWMSHLAGPLDMGQIAVG